MTYSEWENDLKKRGYNTAMAEIMEWIKHMPTAGVRPVKHGRWKVRTQKDGTTIGQHSVTYCSECGYVIFTKENSFCARCGAKMNM